MKIIILCLFCIIRIQLAYSQDKLTYTEVVKVDTLLKKDELYARARLWFVKIFVNAKNVLQIQDKESGELVGKGAIKYNNTILGTKTVVDGWIRFTVNITIKDGKYKYEFTDFIHEGTQISPMGKPFDFGLITADNEAPENIKASKSWKNKQYLTIKKTINDDIIFIISKLKTAMNKPATDW